MPIQLCTRIFPDGHTCGSPALRGERLCYFHHPSRHPTSSRYPRRAPRGFTLAVPRTRQEFQSALSEVIRRLAANKLDTKRGGLLMSVPGDALPCGPETSVTSPLRRLVLGIERV